jgi:hypothetical protein
MTGSTPPACRAARRQASSAIQPSVTTTAREIGDLGIEEQLAE